MTTGAEWDPVLAPYIAATSESAAQDLLGRVLHETVSPLIWKIVRQKLAYGSSREDLEDVHATTILRLTRYLTVARSGPEAVPVASLSDYTAVAAYNACASFLERRAPERTRLAYRLRYVLSRSPALVLWQEGEEWLCGSKGAEPATRAGDSSGSRPGAEEVARELAAAILAEGDRPRDLPRVLGALFAKLDGPCRFEAVLDALVHATGAEARGGEISIDEAPAEPRDAAPDAEARLDGRTYFRRLWSEIVLLPREQRAALLLNLRDEAGRDVLGLLIREEVVPVAQVAEALDMTPPSLEALLPELPREDRWIARRLAVTPRQVTNMRKAARARLGRRMRGF